MGVFAIGIRVRVGNHHPIYIVNVGKRSDTNLIADEEHQKCQREGYISARLLHVRVIMIKKRTRRYKKYFKYLNMF